MSGQSSNVLTSRIKSFPAPVERETIFLAFVAGLVVMIAVYRIDMAVTIYSSNMAGVEPAEVPLTAFLKTLGNALILIALLGGSYLGVKICLRQVLPQVTSWKSFAIAEATVAVSILLFIALITRIYFQILSHLSVGLTLTLVRLAPQMFSKKDFFHMLTWCDYLFLAVPVATFFLSLAFIGCLKRIYKPVGIVLFALVLTTQLFPAKKLSPEITDNPVIYLLADALHTERYQNSDYNRRHDLPGASQMNSIRLIDAAFVNTNENSPLPSVRSRLAPDGRSWNILIFVLESTGADYIFDASHGNQIPMPFLKKMSDEGLYLSNHFAAANLSARAAFSIFTGLYPPPASTTLCMEKNLVIPAFNRYLPPGYDYFFVHPTSPSYWFPECLFLNNQLPELDTMETIPPGVHGDVTTEARNEIHCFNFLRLRLDQAHEPFLAVYWSYVPHYPYSDYGPDFRIRPDLTSSRDRYYNNLRLLDDQIHRIWLHLEETGVADHTLFVFLGDHGEAFGQHGLWGHAFGSYDETYHVPVVFWQPNLIKPQVIKFPTSHVDIVPTLLDLLGVPYNPSRFQGDSVLRGVPNRKYIFTMDGYASYVSAISQNMKKVSLCFDKNDAAAFDLTKDPDERFSMNEHAFPDEVEAILKFRNFQSQMIANYNQALLKGSIYPQKSSIHPIPQN